jgi:hypothetical protein
MNEKQAPMDTWTPFVVYVERNDIQQTTFFNATGFSHAFDRMFVGSFAQFGRNCEKITIQRREKKIDYVL